MFFLFWAYRKNSHDHYGYDWPDATKKAARNNNPEYVSILAQGDRENCSCLLPAWHSCIAEEQENFTTGTKGRLQVKQGYLKVASSTNPFTTHHKVL